MGWFAGNAVNCVLQPQHTQISSKQATKAFVPASTDVPNDILSVVPNAEVRKRKDLPNQELWIVIDNIVYDCTKFALEHPGGAAVLERFRGQDCSWQFWRFHNVEIFHEHCWSLRVGRTEGVQNPFLEVPRFVGAGKLFMASDDD